jgi:obg-like ATPase 1
MPPKKKGEEPKRVILGRPGNNLKVSLPAHTLWCKVLMKQIGIVGVPNVGKSSFFNTLSQTDLGKAANFPYATM